MTPTRLLVPTFTHMLETLSGLLDKAQRGIADDADILGAQLADDMYPLAAQIRFAAFQAQAAVFRLRGEAVPPWLEAVAAEGYASNDAPGTIIQARKRIDEALTLLAGLPGDALDDGAILPVTLELPTGIIFDMTGEEFARDWALPQFYFHVVTAYAILRSRGIDIGKADFVPYMARYQRPVGEDHAGGMPPASQHEQGRSNGGRFVIREDDLTGEASRDLIAEHMKGMLQDSPPGSVFALDLSGLLRPDVTVWTAWHNDRIAGVGALRMLADGNGEVKSMRTHRDFL